MTHWGHRCHRLVSNAFLFFLAAVLLPGSLALMAELQTCTTPIEICQRVAATSPSTITPYMARLVLARLQKHFMLASNNSQCTSDERKRIVDANSPLLQNYCTNCRSVLLHTVEVLLHPSPRDAQHIDILVDGIKAGAQIARLVHPVDPSMSRDIGRILLSGIGSSSFSEGLGHHHVTGLQWATETLQLILDSDELEVVGMSQALEEYLQKEGASFDTPFHIYPGLLLVESNDYRFPSISDTLKQVSFQQDSIRSSATGQLVRERRHTAWMGDDSTSVGPFAYSGKAMPRQDWSPLVRGVRDQLFEKYHVYYNCCLLNLYPGGSDGRAPSGMRYHRDPDQGVLWSNDTSVVSMGATRRFAFRSVATGETAPHAFTVSHGDVTRMVRDCQTRYEHTVKKADFSTDTAPRISMVFKQTLDISQKAGVGELQ